MQNSEYSIGPVTLIRPSFVLPVTSHQSQQGVPSLGLAYLAGSLKANGYSVHCIDAPGENLGVFHKHEVDGLLIHGLLPHEIVARIPKDTFLIGVSCMYANEWLYTRKLLDEIKKTFPNTLLIAGGEYVTADYEYILNTCPSIDICVRGEGEETLIELMGRLTNSQPYGDLHGLAFRNNEGAIVKNQPRARIKEVGKIPWPDWSGLPLENYLSTGRGNDTMKTRSMPILASRGCPYRCSFCTSPQMWTTKWSARNPADVISEMKLHIQNHRVNHFEFYDLTMIIQSKWIEEFCDLLEKEKLNITWSLPSGTRTEALTYNVLKRIHETGCLKLTLSPESGSKATLTRMRKKLKPESMLRVIRDCNRVGLVTKCNIIFGLPDQTWFQVFENFIYIFRMALAGANDNACFSFVPYPGSEFFEMLVQQGKIQRDANYELFLAKNIYNDTSELRSWSEHISSRAIPFLVIGGMLYFYFWSFLFRPHRLFQVINRLVRRKPVTMLEMLLDGLYENFVVGRKLVQ